MRHRKMQGVICESAASSFACTDTTTVTEKEILPLGRTTAMYQGLEEQRKQVQREQMAD